jgi:DNA-3-methyladenine glycosylase I
MLDRCQWVSLDDELMVAYHDVEWGTPVHDDRVLFEFLVLEAAQAGLSWRTILRKRENYRAAFENFDPKAVAGFDAQRVDELLGDEGIVRNRLKIESTVTNAECFLHVQAEYGSFDAYLWGWVDGETVHGAFATISDIPAKTPLAEDISRDLKRRGFRFVGPTITYAFLQATGVVNDHTLDCHRYAELKG